MKEETKEEIKNEEESKKEPTMEEETKEEIKNEEESKKELIKKEETKEDIKNEEESKKEIIKEEEPKNEIIKEEEPKIEKKYSEIINKNQIKFDMLKIFSLVRKDGVYKEGDFLFELYKGYKPVNPEEEQEDFPKYLVDIKHEEFRYIGVLSNNLNKEVYGYNIFENGDEYFGQWNKNIKEGYGIYYYKENEKDESRIKHIYIGEFKNNKKHGEGVYFKIKQFEKGKEGVVRPCDFNFNLGKFDDDNFISGIIYNIEGEKRQIYLGNLDEKGEKCDENAEIYENNNQIFNGTIKNNIMIKGRIIILKEEENQIKKEEAYYFERKEDKINNEDIDFDYRKLEEKDELLIQKMKNIFEMYDCEKLKDLYMKAIELRDKIRSPYNFQFIKDLDYDEMVKKEFLNIYGKYIYTD